MVAADKGRPSMKSTVKVKITLEDVCDSKPKFEKDPYVVFLDEDVRMHDYLLLCANILIDITRLFYRASQLG